MRPISGTSTTGGAGWALAATAAIAICILGVAATVPESRAIPVPEVAVGGARGYYCALLMVGKWFFLANPGVFLGLAIAGGLACGFAL